MASVELLVFRRLIIHGEAGVKLMCRLANQELILVTATSFSASRSAGLISLQGGLEFNHPVVYSDIFPSSYDSVGVFRLRLVQSMG